jgi:hypothetical protein
MGLYFISHATSVTLISNLADEIHVQEADHGGRSLNHEVRNETSDL